MLKNKSCIITGASSGLGLEIAKKFLSEGYSIAICSRSKEKLEKATDELYKIKNKKQSISLKNLDVSNEIAVKVFIKESIMFFGKIDCLVNNAGIYGPFGKIEDTNSKEWEQCIKTNLLGPYYTMKHIIPHMKKNKYGKIINLSGGGATQPLPFISSYASTKCAIVRLTESIAQEVKDYNIDINAIAPGALDTGMYKEILKAGPEKVGKEFYDKITNQGKTPLSLGADLCYYLASHESDGISGRLISAVWDEWKEFKKEELIGDIYTLRRVVK